MGHEKVRAAAEEYAKKWIKVPLEYQRYAIDTFLAGYDFHTKVILDNIPKCEDFTPGQTEYYVYHHIQGYINGIEPIGELICHLRRMFAPQRDDDYYGEQQEKAMSIKEEPKLPWKQLSLFD